MTHHDGGFFSHWGFGFGHWTLGILFWAAILIVIILGIKAIQKSN